METPSNKPPLHTLQVLPYTSFNRIFALVYMCAIMALFYHQTTTLLSSTTTFFIHLTLLFSNAVLAFMWTTTQSFRMNPVKRNTYPENLKEYYTDVSEYPNLDVFICTADPYKEPPMNVVNTALSVMAYDYPSDKISVYVSDDGGSELTLFAFMEAAKFAKHWLPFCRVNDIVDRCPEVYFRSSHSWCPELNQIKMMYERMKAKVEAVVENGRVGNGDNISMNDQEREAFKKWTDGFTRRNHPTVIQVLLESEKDKDVVGQEMPNLVYVSREKSKSSPHHFKAGALNTLLRVSATMTNAPLVLTLDCDTISNDPKTLLRVLCYLADRAKASKLAYFQFPQRFHGLNKNDTYGSQFMRLYICNPVGMDGLAGPTYVGTGCFFRRRAFFGGPTSFLSPEKPELNPEYVVVSKSITSRQNLEVANHVASCDYENGTNWGSKMGFRYGSLVEDYYTAYRWQCEGWKTVLCNPKRAAFLGDVPINLDDVMSQNKRWVLGLLEVNFSKYNPLIFGVRSMGPLMGLAYAHNAFWPSWSIPIIAYALIPQLALLNRVVLFPKASDPWFYLYVFLFLGSYIQDFIDFILFRGTIGQWWNDQRMWLIRGLTSYLFGSIDFILKSFGTSSLGFNVTSKVVDDEQNKRYAQGLFEFGVASPFFVPLVTTAMINLIAFVVGITKVVLASDGNIGDMFVQFFISGFVMVNCWPVYEAIALRSDKGKMPMKITIVSIVIAVSLYLLGSLMF